MKLLFVHVPKTGGTSIKDFLESVGQDEWNRSWPMGHDPYFELEKNNNIDNNVYSFAVVRNPYTRAYSYYRHYLTQNNVSESFYDFLNQVRVKYSAEKTPMMIYNQSFYTHDCFGNFKLSKLYRFENLKELEEDLEITLPKLRIGEYSKEEMIESYSHDIIKLVKHLYFEDFYNFSYPLDFSYVAE